MNMYEMGVVLRADLEEEVYRAEMEKVKGFIDRFGGTIEKVDDWGRRKLAYPIQKLSEGMYTFITYSSEGPTPSLVEERLRLMESVLRFLTIRKDESEVVIEEAKPEKADDEKAKEEPAESAPEPASEAANEENSNDAPEETPEEAKENTNE